MCSNTFWSFLLAASFLGCCSAAGDRRHLSSFQEIRDFVLNEYGVVTASFDLEACEGPNDAEFYKSKIYLEHMNDVWLYRKRADGSEVLRSNDLYIEGKWIYTRTLLNNKGQASINFVDHAGGDFSVVRNVTFVCQIGSSATFRGLNSGVPREDFKTYSDLKEALLSGRELVARAEVSQCPGPNWQELGIDTFLAGYKIKSARIVDEDTLEEAIIMDVYAFSDDYSSIVTSPLALGLVFHTIKPTGSVRIVPGAVDLYTFVVDHPHSTGYNCTIGTSYTVSAPVQKKLPQRLNSYEEVEQTVKAGDLVSAVMDTRLCKWEGKQPDFEGILVRKFSPWVHGVKLPPYGTFVELFTLLIRRVDVKKIQEKFLVLQNNTVVYEVLSIDPKGKSQELKTARCSLGCGIKFTKSSEAPREEIRCPEVLKAAALKGKELTWVVDYKKCEGPDVENSVFNAHGGGLLVNMDVDTETGVMHSSGNAISTFLVENKETAAEPIRAQQPVTIYPDGKVTVTRTFNVADASFRQVGKALEFTCKLGESVFFFE